jgi:hypothetical protein
MTILGIMIRTMIVAILCAIALNPIDHLQYTSKFPWWGSVLFLSIMYWGLIELLVYDTKKRKDDT